MSPMWLTSKTPTLPRTALCSAIKPPLDGYSTGISQPPKLTIFAPRRRCNAFRGVLRSSLMREIVEDSIPIARAGTDTNMHLGSGQRSLAFGRALSHRIPLARLKCVSPKRRLEMAARLGGEPGGARKLESSRHGYFRPLFRSGA